MVRKNLLQFIFSGSCLWRWNDKLRPVELAEIDKQGHKMLVAFALCHEYASKLELSDRLALTSRLIEGALFDYFYRLIITDIKPPVFYQIRANRDHYQKLTEYVLGRLEPMLAPLGPFWNRMRQWHKDYEMEDPARRILAAAHLYASRWEFQLIQPHNSFDEEMCNIAASFNENLARYEDLPGVLQILDKTSALGKFANLCGQLRFQIRWTQLARVPHTSVLGHMFMVASCAYLFSLSLNFSRARANNNFFGGLLHDFPELLTRDIISPVKSSVPELSRLIREYEEKELERRILSPLRAAGYEGLVKRLSFYLGIETGSEFQEACIKNGRVLQVNGFESLNEQDCEEADPKDGELIKICDLLAAFLEAHNSISTGISSPQLQEARARLKGRLKDMDLPNLQLDALLSDFD